MEKDLVQSLKLDISKKFRLSPYERMAFHSILTLRKTENALEILKTDLAKSPVVRKSAINALVTFEDDAVHDILVKLLKKELSIDETILIIDYLSDHGREEDIPLIRSFIANSMQNPGLSPAIPHAFESIRQTGAADNETRSFLLDIINDKNVDPYIKYYAIRACTIFRDIGLFENLLRQDNEQFRSSCFNSLAILSRELRKEAEQQREEKVQEYGYQPTATDPDDSTIVDIRVLLGKYSSRFQDYETATKISFVEAMIESNHRETHIYVMNALTSGNEELLFEGLNLLLRTIHRIRDHDNLFRSLIALTVEHDYNNELIINIFVNFFTNLLENRNTNLLRDKLFNYIVVTLETYFEQYRKEFMITDVIEKDYSDDIQKVRHFIRENLNARVHNKIKNFLSSDNREAIQNLFSQMADVVPFLSDQNKDSLYLLISLLYESDTRSREISSDRLEAIKFDKRYLRSKILRLCDIIARLNITAAATPLVKIFNYVKKYHDPEIFHGVASALSRLNYSYMLGELELLLVSGDIDDQHNAIRYISQFSDQHSLNIMLDFIQEPGNIHDDVLISALNILIRREITGNVAAPDTFKKVMSISENEEVIRLAILCLGKSGSEADIDYLNNLFNETGYRGPKQAVVLAISSIILSTKDYNKRQVTKYLKDYLRESDIRVRMYACALLINIGNKEAFQTLKDMMVIKNKSIQRELLFILRNSINLEFAYFLISLFSEDYAISRDIVSLFSNLQEEHLIDIESFVTNLYKKYERIGLETREEAETARTTEESSFLKSITKVEAPHVQISIQNFYQLMKRSSIIELTFLHTRIMEYIISNIEEHEGSISNTIDGTIDCYFSNSTRALQAATAIRSSLQKFNAMVITDRKILAFIQVVHSPLITLNGEIISHPEYRLHTPVSQYTGTALIIDEKIYQDSKEEYFTLPYPEQNMEIPLAHSLHYMLISSRNLFQLAEQYLNDIIVTEKKDIERRDQIEEEIRRKKIQMRSPQTTEYAEALDNLNIMLKNELANINNYVQKRTTDREMIVNVEKMLDKVHRRFITEIAKIIM